MLRPPPKATRVYTLFPYRTLVLSVLRLRLGDHCHQLARARLGQREGVAHDPLDSGAGEDRDFGGDLPCQAPVRAPALASIFAFGVLAHDHPVEEIGRASWRERVCQYVEL